MPRPVRYRCETLVTPLCPDYVTELVTMQTARQAASVWGLERHFQDGQMYAVRPDRWGGRPTYWEWRRGMPWSVSVPETRRRFPTYDI